MLLLLVLCLNILFISWLIGFFILKILQKSPLIENKGSNIFNQIDFVAIFGLATLTVLLEIIHPFIRINWEVVFCFHLLCLIILFYYKGEIFGYIKYYISSLTKPKTLIYRIPILIIILGVFMLAVMPTKNYDVGLYHAQNIQWIQEYSTVPGIGNLHIRFAFNSISFYLEAFFSYSFFGLKPVYSINTYVFMLLSIRLGKCLEEGFFILQPFKILFALLTPLLFIHLGYGYFISSPSPDLSSAIFFIFLFFLFIENHQNREGSIYTFILLFLSAFTFTTKISYLPTVLIAFWVIFQYRLQLLKGNYLLILIPAIPILPWFIINVITSGYLIIPFASLDFFSFDWEVPKSLMEIIRGMVRNTVIGGGNKNHILMDMNIFQWFPIWWERQSLIRVIMYCINFSSPLLLLLTYLVVKKWDRVLFYFWLFCYLGFFFWLLNGPDLRYGWGYLQICTFLAFFPILMYSSTQKKYVQNILLALVYSILICFLTINIFYHTTGKTPFTKKLIVTDQELNYELKKIEVEGKIVYYPIKGERCGNAPLPCMRSSEINFEFRGEDLQDGFRPKEGVIFSPQRQ